MKKIPLTQGKFALVDDEDFSSLDMLNWFAKKSSSGVFYAATTKNYKTVFMHRVILNPTENLQVDHIDGNGLNNTRANLRICTFLDNLKNKRISKNNKTGFKGVVIERNKYKAQISVNGRSINLGRFITAGEAASAYDKAALKYFGEFASLNFPKNTTE